MKIYDYLSIENIYVCGDIHGEFKTFFNKVKRLLNYDKQKYSEEVHPLVKEEEENERAQHMVLNDLDLQSHWWEYKPRFSKTRFTLENSVVVVCGDCGFGFNKPQYYLDLLEKANELFASTNTHILFVRGNHDDPSYFDGEVINMSNIKAIPDYSVIKTINSTTLCVGGAISVDRLWRKQQEVRLNKYSKSKSKKLYWDGEEVFLNENVLDELRDNNIKLNGVITHTSPSFAFPNEKDSALGWFKLDTKLKDDLKTERKTLDKLFELLISEHEIKTWSYGHFHNNNYELIKGIAFIANDDDYTITNPITTYNELKAIEEINKNKKRRNKKEKSEYDFTEWDVVPNVPQPIEVDLGEDIDGEPIRRAVEEADEAERQLIEDALDRPIDARYFRPLDVDMLREAREVVGGDNENNDVLRDPIFEAIGDEEEAPF